MRRFVITFAVGLFVFGLFVPFVRRIVRMLIADHHYRVGILDNVIGGLIGGKVLGCRQRTTIPIRHALARMQANGTGKWIDLAHGRSASMADGEFHLSYRRSALQQSTDN